MNDDETFPPALPLDPIDVATSAIADDVTMLVLAGVALVFALAAVLCGFAMNWGRGPREPKPDPVDDAPTVGELW